MMMRTRSELTPADSLLGVPTAFERERALMLLRSSDDDSDDEDETAALMAELAKIKQERAEEKARQVSPLIHSHSAQSSPPSPPLIPFLSENIAPPPLSSETS